MALPGPILARRSHPSPKTNVPPPSASPILLALSLESSFLNELSSPVVYRSPEKNIQNTFLGYIVHFLDYSRLLLALLLV